MILLDRTGKDELLETAMALHEAAMKDEYFTSRKLAPNVDFWWVVSLFLYIDQLLMILKQEVIVPLVGAWTVTDAFSMLRNSNPTGAAD